MVIWNRLDLARRDDEKDAIRSLDLLYRRVETEILKREASPAMRLLNDLLNMHDGFDDEGWLKECRKSMIDTFPREDPFSILVPSGFDIDKHQGPLRLPAEADDALLRVDFVREVDALLQEVRLEENESQSAGGLDPESVASRLKQQEKQRTIRQVEALLELAINLQW
ncbi:protein PALE CRESS, chloroplastic [Carica papaya]|uniref:protein PALE CRESS, chloroplastic n=1 Tax=Carica papaya TaxID=3649 RepID=UPI000B8CA986|nr:protein PALE CRESS, chloroplastic [Carica papaya]